MNGFRQTSSAIFSAGFAVLFCVIGIAAMAQTPRREIKWNNPDGPKIPNVEHSSFHSASMDTEVGFSIYLPDGYARGRTRYPVIYFLHGAGGDENSDAGGFSGLIAKRIAEKKSSPVICVFPNGGMSGYQDHPDEKVMGETMLIQELIPFIDRTYRTQRGRYNREIAGFSMGGGGAIRLALKHPDLFSAAASWAGAIVPRSGAVPAELEPDNLRKLAGKVRLLLIVGDQDITFNGHKPVIERLTEAQYPVKYHVLEGVPHNLGQYYEKTGDEMARFLTEKF